MGALNIVIGVVLLLSAVIMIVTILMQQSRQQGLGAISGGAETFFGKSKARSLDARLAFITKIASGIFVILSIVYLLLNK